VSGWKSGVILVSITGDHASTEIAVPIEFPGDSRYSGGADEFVRQGFIRVHTGWRREEWAYRPLFICGKLHPEIT
jgi:hypothetical protein